MSNDETNVYLQAKMQQQAQVPESGEPPKKTPASKTTKKAQTQSEEDPQLMFDMQAFRQMVQDVIRAELQTLHIEQPQPLDIRVFQQAMQPVIRAELQSIQTALTILANAVQAQAEVLMQEDNDVTEEEEQDALLPTSPSVHDTDEETEREFPDPQDEYEDEGDEEEGEGGEEDDLMDMLPRPPEPPTHTLRRPKGPGVLILREAYPTNGKRRWEPYSDEM